MTFQEFFKVVHTYHTRQEGQEIGTWALELGGLGVQFWLHFLSAV